MGLELALIPILLAGLVFVLFYFKNSEPFYDLDEKRQQNRKSLLEPYTQLLNIYLFLENKSDKIDVCIVGLDGEYFSVPEILRVNGHGRVMVTQPEVKSILVSIDLKEEDLDYVVKTLLSNYSVYFPPIDFKDYSGIHCRLDKDGALQVGR